MSNNVIHMVIVYCHFVLMILQNVVVQQDIPILKYLDKVKLYTQNVVLLMLVLMKQKTLLVLKQKFGCISGVKTL